MGSRWKRSTGRRGDARRADRGLAPQGEPVGLALSAPLGSASLLRPRIPEHYQSTLWAKTGEILCRSPEGSGSQLHLGGVLRSPFGIVRKEQDSCRVLFPTALNVSRH